MKRVAIALVVVGLTTPAFAQFQQLRQFGAGPNPNTTWPDRYNQNDSVYNQQEQRTSPNGYQSDSYNVLGNNTPDRTIRLTTPSFFLSR